MTETVVKVEGLEDLREVLLRKLPERLRGRALQGALAQAAKPILAAARARAPVDTGRERRAIYSKRSKLSRPELERRIIGVAYRKKILGRFPFYWKFVEFGHRVGNRKTGYLQKNGRGSGHTGTVSVVPARPFMRPAFELHKGEALEILTRELAAEIDKVALAAQAKSAKRLRRAALGF